MSRRSTVLYLILTCLLLMSSTIGAQSPAKLAPPASVPHQIVVKYSAQANPSLQLKGGVPINSLHNVNELHQTHGITEERKLYAKPILSDDHPLARVHILTVPEGSDLEAIAADYGALTEVEYAHPDHLMELHELPNDSLFGHQWALVNTGQDHFHVDRLDGDFNDTLAIVSGVSGADIHARSVLENPPDRTDVVVVAIIDTGIDRDHPELADRFWINTDEIEGNGIDDDHNGYIDDTWGWDFSGSSEEEPPGLQDNDPSDYVGHGTHCAGIVAALTNNNIGVAGATAPVRVMTVKIFPWALQSVVAVSVVYAADNGADVISMSFGSPLGSSVMQQSLAYAKDLNVSLIASAGNDGYESNFYPASYLETMCITASNDSDQIADWSTYSAAASVCAPGQSILSLRAAGTDLYDMHDEPGVHIIDSIYYMASGTSMSGPYAAAIAAWIRAVSPGYDTDSVRALIQASADDIVDPYGLGENLIGWDKYSGYGRINLEEALNLAPSQRARIDAPAIAEVVGGVIDIAGAADGDGFGNYNLEYRFQDETSWTNLVTSSTPVTDGVLGSFESTGRNGLVNFRLSVGHTHTALRKFWVANSALCEFQAPLDGDTATGIVFMTGNAICPDFVQTTIEYRPDLDSSEWTEAGTTGVPAYGSDIFGWQVSTIPDGRYWIKASVYSEAGLEAVDSLRVYIRSTFAPPHGWSVPLTAAPGFSSNYGDFDNDGQTELVIGTSEGVVFYNLDGTQKTTGVPTLPVGDFRVVPAVGNLDGDGIDDLVCIAAADSGVLYGFPSSGGNFVTTIGQRPVTFQGSFRTGSKIFLKDINNDGLDEIHYSPGYSRNPRPSFYFIRRPDGTPFGQNLPLPDEYVWGYAADLDGDHHDELYHYHPPSSQLYQFDSLGQAVDSIILQVEGLAFMPASISASAIDIDEDGKHELMLWAASSPNPYDPGAHSNNHFFALDEGLVLKDGWPHDTQVSAFYSGTNPVFCDINGDGQLEYFCAFWDDTYHRIFGWNLDGTPFMDGEDGFFASPELPSYLSDVVAVDLNGDGVTDLAAAALRDLFGSYPMERIVAYDRTAELLEGYPIVAKYPVDGLDAKGCPLFGDLDGDGYLDLTYASQDQLAFANLPGVIFSPSAATWPMRLGGRRLNNTSPLPDQGPSICGDIDGSGDEVNIADLVFLVAFMFQSGPPPPDLVACDVDGSGSGPDIADLVYLVAYMFGSGAPLQCPE